MVIGVEEMKGRLRGIVMAVVGSDIVISLPLGD